MKKLIVILMLVANQSYANPFLDPCGPGGILTDDYCGRREKCPDSQVHFAVVTEHVYYENKSFTCKLISGDGYNENDLEAGIDHINCKETPLSVGDLILIEKSYSLIRDARGKLMCMQETAFKKILGKAVLN
ncbi:MAG: hypothetical protein AB7O96_05590 [Pseudobdellovibrionaceae bacterium]